MYLACEQDKLLSDTLNNIFSKLLQSETNASTHVTDEKIPTEASPWNFTVGKEGGVSMPNNFKMARAFRQASKAYPDINLKSLLEIIAEYGVTEETDSLKFMTTVKDIERKHNLRFGDQGKKLQKMRRIFFKHEHCNPKITSTPVQTRQLLKFLQDSAQCDQFIASVKQQYINNVKKTCEQCIKKYSEQPELKLVIDFEALEQMDMDLTIDFSSGKHKQKAQTFSEQFSLELQINVSSDLKAEFTELQQKSSSISTLTQALDCEIHLNKFCAAHEQHTFALQSDAEYMDSLSRILKTRAKNSVALPVNKQLFNWMHSKSSPDLSSNPIPAMQTKSCCVIS